MRRLLGLSAGLLFPFAALAAPHPPEDVRAIWVTRFEYQSESDVRNILKNCAALGFNTVLFQVRGQADAYYRSSLEPWSERLGGRDPGFDPLDVACRESKRLGLSLHAWVNVMPAWRGRTPPLDPDQICYTHPGWIVVGRDGRRQTFNDHYVCLNPCLPEVREYIVSVLRDLAERYPIDGLHLDYIRFIDGDWSYDAKTLAQFERVAGGSPEQKPEEWTDFRRNSVTELVRMTRRMLSDMRPGAILSAAVFPTAKARARVLQDAEGWIRRGLIDWVFPMTYEGSDSEFKDVIDEGYQLFRSPGASALSPVSRTRRSEVGSSKVVCFPGVGAYKHHTAEQTLHQLSMCRGGFALFSYSSLYVSPDETRRENERLCRARRDALRSFLEK